MSANFLHPSVTGRNGKTAEVPPGDPWPAPPPGAPAMARTATGSGIITSITLALIAIASPSTVQTASS